MTKNFSKKNIGFTLLEILLVLVIASVILIGLVTYTAEQTNQARQNRLSTEIQQILNTAVAYYMTNGVWPDAASGAGLQNILIANNYLPNNFINPYGFNFLIGSGNNDLFFVLAQAPNQTTARSIAGTLPLGFTANSYTVSATGTSPVLLPVQGNCSGNQCYVVGAVSAPPQNLNNAKSTNFGALYHSGACVPAPNCPTNMIPQILVMAAGVSGVYTNPSGGTPTALPISGYTAYATGDSSNNPTTRPYYCNASGAGNYGNTPGPCYQTGPAGGSVPSGYKYWRACLAVTTESGVVNVNDGSAPTPDANTNSWGTATGSILAITRCVPANSSGAVQENIGSDFTVWGQ